MSLVTKKGKLSLWGESTCGNLDEEWNRADSVGMGSQGTNLSRAARDSGSRVSACSFIKDSAV